MIEKRFKEIISIETIVDNKTGLHYKPVMLTDDFLYLINEIADENEQLKIRLNEEKEKALKFCRNIDTLTIENKQLKQRNTNQYNQLNELWKLIEAKDWETLSAMDNQMKEDEERLQQEWKCYE